jgi:type IV fimbrial biogenesis protein FimT
MKTLVYGNSRRFNGKAQRVRMDLMRSKKQLGYTIMEVLVTSTILLVLTSIAVPSFAAILSRAQVSTSASALYETLFLARNEALARQQIVHICQVGGSMETCDSDYSANRDWSRGWLVFADVNENNQLDSTDALIKTVPLQGETTIIFNQRGRLRFFPSGSSRGAGFYLCDKDATVFRHVFLFHSGRARISEKLSENQQRRCAAT